MWTFRAPSCPPTSSRTTILSRFDLRLSSLLWTPNTSPIEVSIPSHSLQRQIQAKQIPNTKRSVSSSCRHPHNRARRAPRIRRTSPDPKISASQLTVKETSSTRISSLTALPMEMIIPFTIFLPRHVQIHPPPSLVQICKRSEPTLQGILPFDPVPLMHSPALVDITQSLIPPSVCHVNDQANVNPEQLHERVSKTNEAVTH